MAVNSFKGKIRRYFRFKAWQSWSPCRSARLKIPLRNYSPFGENDCRLIAETNSDRKIPATGWCSWHAFGENINRRKILANTRWIANRRRLLPLDYILIDDGWTTWGDWLTPNLVKFPGGIKQLVTEINCFGLKAGLWIAPFLVDAGSQLAKLYPDWFIRDGFGELVDGRKISFADKWLLSPRLILDFRLNSVQTYIKRVFETLVQDWRVELLKLDFLYAQHFNPDFKNSEIPDALLKDFLFWIRRTFPKVYTIGCGCPLVPAVNLVDAMRISEDAVNPQLINFPVLKSLVHKSRVRQLELNLMFRSSLKEIWHLDPDAFVCHPAFGLGARMTKKFKELVTSAGGVIFLGDNLVGLDKDSVFRYLLPLFKT